MSFSYQYGANPSIDYVRLLVSDTVDSGHIFEDAEITSAAAICRAQFQSSQRYSGSAGANLPSTPVAYLRVAALLLDILATNKARLAVTRLLDTELDFATVSKSLREQAKAYRETDDNAGAFVIIEQCNTGFTFRDRFLKQIQRQNT